MAEFLVDNLREVQDLVSPAHDAERALIAAIRALSIELSIDGACRAALDAIERIFGATSSWILVRDHSNRCLRLAASRGLGSDVYRDARIPDDDPALSALVCSERKVVFVPDVRSEVRWFDPDRVRNSGLQSLLMVPLLFKGQTVGVIVMTAPQFTAASPPQVLDVERLHALAAQVAIAFTNARVLEDSENDRQRLRRLMKERRQLSAQISHLEQGIAANCGIVGESEELTAVIGQVEVVAGSDATVLLLGETGTGKELLARLLHQQSRRSRRPFIAVNCAALPHSLIESELFGHERGAFTGAIDRKPGSFEIANGGTLFLDEVGDLPENAQAKLLRVLQEKVVRRVGGTRPVAVDVRVVAATNHDLNQAMADGQFRADLFYRLSVFPIRVPPLRERRDDIPALAMYFLRRFTRNLGRSLEGFDSTALALLKEYPWPGNVRELQNVVERAVILAAEPVLDAGDLYLPNSVPVPRRYIDRTPPDERPQSLADAERTAILRTLNATGWRISGPDGAAERLGLKATTLHSRMRRLGLKRPAPHASPEPPNRQAASRSGVPSVE